MILPTHDSRVLRLDGLPGLLLYIPIIGRSLKFLFLNIMAKIQNGHLYSLPNQRFGKSVCPELVGRFSIDEARSILHHLLADKARYDAIISTFKSLDAVIDPLDDLIAWIKRTS